MNKSKILTKLFHLLWLVKRPMTMGVRVIVEASDKKILLVRHTYVSGWHLPGGGIEVGEVAADAARKEVLEEACLKVNGIPKLISVHQNKATTKRDHVLVYYVNDWEQDGEFVSNAEIAEIGFFELDGLPDGVTRSTKRRLDEFYNDATASDYW